MLYPNIIIAQRNSFVPSPQSVNPQSSAWAECLPCIPGGLPVKKWFSRSSNSCFWLLRPTHGREVNVAGRGVTVRIRNKPWDAEGFRGRGLQQGCRGDEFRRSQVRWDWGGVGRRCFAGNLGLWPHAGHSPSQWFMESLCLLPQPLPWSFLLFHHPRSRQHSFTFLPVFVFLFFFLVGGGLT